MRNNNNLTFEVAHGDGSSGQRLRAFINDNSVTFNQWHHVAVTWDGFTLVSGVSIYIDGVKKTLVFTQNGTGSRVTDAPYDQLVGFAILNSRAFDGLIDDVRIYSRTLSPSDITELYNYTSADTQAPTVSITAPSAGATVADTVTFSANASDNVGVMEVEFFVDGASKGTDMTSPYAQPIQHGP